MNTSPTLADTNLAVSVTLEALKLPTAGTQGIAISNLVGLNGTGPANVTDSDAGAVTGIALVGTDELYGYWWFSTDDGAHWALVGTVNDSDSALLLRPTDRLYFQPNVAVPSTVGQALTIRAWDQATGVAGTKVAISTATGSAFSADTDGVALNPSVLVPNGSFDNGLTGWTYTGGSTVASTGDGHEGAITSESGKTPVELEDFLGLSHGTIASATGTTPSAGHAMKMSTTVTFTEDTTLAMDWSFTYSDSGTYVDFGFVSVNGVVTLLAKGTNASGTFSTTIPANTTLSLGFGASDVGDNSVNPVLRVDNIRVTTVSPTPSNPAFPTPSAPNAPSAPDLLAASDTGIFSTDNTTSATTPTFTGTADDGASVTLYDGATVVGSAVATGGAWSITTSALAQGTHALVARAGDGTAYVSSFSGGLTVVVDTAPPPAPVLTSSALTNQNPPTIVGTAEAGALITLVIGTGNAQYTTTANGNGNWSINLGSATLVAGTLSLNANGSNSVSVTAKDAAGNVSQPATQALAIDAQVPTLAASTPLDNATGVSTTNDLVLTFSENVTAAEGLVKLWKTGGSSAVETFDVTTGEGSLGGTVFLNGTTLTLNPHDDLAYGTGYYLLADVGIVRDLANNYFNGITSAEGLNFTTVAAPVSGGDDSDPFTPPPPPTPVVDGVPITSTTGPNGTITTTVPVVTSTRTDTPGSASGLADIPLAKDASGQSLLQVGVPTGMGLTAEGLPNTHSGAAAQADLTQRIQKLAGAGSDLGPQAQAFLAALGTGTPLTVQTITPTTATGFNPNVPLVITGGGGNQAIVIDARSLPSGTIIQVDNVEFIAVVGNVRLVGGAGQNIASGDGAAQWIVLGPDDDIIHGGAGNDVVGSEGGNDQVFGDAGDDTVFGGAGNDVLSGGTGSDRINGGSGFDVALQEGKRTDYALTLEGAGIKLTHIASGVSDWLVDVEQVRFESGPMLTVAHSTAEEAAAFLFSKWLGRDLAQSEGAVIQTLAGQTAEQVATLFAQVFPNQTAGKTTAQLLDGMAAAGAMRVDAVRDVLVSGDAGNNTITPTLGLARSVDGGAGIDTVVLTGSLAQTHVQHNANGSYTLQRMTDGAMLDVTHVERITLSDTKLALDLDGHAGQAAKLLGALGGPALLGNKGLVGEAIRALDAGVSAQSLAHIGLQALGAQTPAQVVQVLWTSLMGRAGTQAELQPFIDLMAKGATDGELAVLAGDLAANATRIDLVGLAAKGIEFN